MTRNSIPGYVYHKQLVSSQELKTLVTRLSNPQSYYFVRYPHTITGICKQLPAPFDNGQIEGQMFSSICELRWKKYKSSYEVLVLSKQPFEFEGFEKVSENWEICDLNAYWHDRKEPKFPKGFIFKGIDNQDIDPQTIRIQQRYFQDPTTAIVHFVALTVNEQ